VHAKLGRLHFPAHLEQHGRFFHESVEVDSYRSVALAASPEALLAYTALEPLFSSLYEPLALRSGRAFSPYYSEGKSPEMGRERRLNRWRAANAYFSALGLEVEAELSALRPEGGWVRLRANEQLAAKIALAESMHREAQRLGPALLGARNRAFRLRPLLERYYAQADTEGRALRQRVLTKKLEVTLSAFFGGDWLAFLNYLGEEPHLEEHVATALPETRLYLNSSRKSTEDLGIKDVSVEQLRLIATSLYGGESSPVEQRVSTLKRYWDAFDAIHARQRSGMEPLWGLVEESATQGFILSRSVRDDKRLYRVGLYRRLLPASLLKEIDQLWGSVMLPREPDRIVTELSPHALMAKTFGPALRFWQGCALTAWFLCDDNSDSRTNMAGLEHYYRRELAELDGHGTPVDREMFAELIAAEERLAPEEPFHEKTQQIEVEPDLILEPGMPLVSREEGFEHLRDIVTKYRRAWAEKHLDNYLRTRAEGDVRKAAQTYYRKTAERGGKPPTPKQFAGIAEGPTNRWFSGDVSALYRAFGERSPVSPERVRLVPEDAESFVRRVYSALGGVEVGLCPPEPDQQQIENYSRKLKENSSKDMLANKALRYLRLEETLSKAPTLEEFGKDVFTYYQAEAALGVDTEEGWAHYESIIRNVLTPEEFEKESAQSIRSCGHAQLHMEEHHTTLRDDRHRLPNDRSE